MKSAVFGALFLALLCGSQSIAQVVEAGGPPKDRITDQDRARFITYVKGQNFLPVRIEGEITEGRELPGEIVYYKVPGEYGVKHQFTVVNGKIVLVDSGTRKIAQLVED